jgi:hypothetical protein
MTACGASAADRLAAVSENVDRIQSGVLEMRLSIASVAEPETPIGFEMRGPFDLAGDGLEADLTYRQVAGSVDEEVRFIVAEGRAFVQTDGAFFEIPVEEQAPQAETPTMLQDLALEDWAADPTVVEGGDGRSTITSPLHEVAALEGLLRMLDQVGMAEASGVAALRELDDEVLERSVDSGSMIVRAGPDDLLRALVVRIRFGLDPSSPLDKALEGVAGAELLFEVEITRTGRSIVVGVPEDAQPISELPGF